jgi:hypothetical protein
MIDYCIERNMEIEVVYLSDYCFIIFNNLMTKSDDVNVIHKTNSSLLVNYKGADIKFALGSFILDEQYKVDFSKLQTGQETYLFKDFYIKLR